MKEKYSIKTGLMICIPCFIIAVISFSLCLADDTAIPYSVLCAVLTFSLTFGFIIALNTNWRKNGGERDHSCVVGMQQNFESERDHAVFEIIEYDATYENELMGLIEEEGDDWAIYWKEPNATLYRKSFEQSITYLALADGKICGYVRSIKDALFIYVCDLLVNKRYRGHGLGKQLIQRLKTDFPNHPAYVMSGNDGYYQSIGAKKEGSVYLV